MVWLWGFLRRFQGRQKCQEIGYLLRGHVLEQQFGHQALSLSNQFFDLVCGNDCLLVLGVSEDNLLVRFPGQQSGVNLARSCLNNVGELVRIDFSRRIEDLVEQFAATVFLADAVEVRPNRLAFAGDAVTVSTLHAL